jgi:hypothetical protein
MHLNMQKKKWSLKKSSFRNKKDVIKIYLLKSLYVHVDMFIQIVNNWNCKHHNHIINIYIRSLNVKGRANKGEDFKGVGCWNGKDFHFQ